MNIKRFARTSIASNHYHFLERKISHIEKDKGEMEFLLPTVYILIHYKILISSIYLCKLKSNENQEERKCIIKVSKMIFNNNRYNALLQIIFKALSYTQYYPLQQFYEIVK